MPVVVGQEIFAHIIGSLLEIILVVFSLVNGQQGVLAIIRSEHIVVTIRELRGVVGINP